MSVRSVNFGRLESFDVFVTYLIVMLVTFCLSFMMFHLAQHSEFVYNMYIQGVHNYKPAIFCVELPVHFYCVLKISCKNF